MARIVDGTEMNMIGDKLRALRTANGWSQQAVSDKLEMLAIYVCRGSISRIEDKQRTVTDIELYGLSQVFHVPVTYPPPRSPRTPRRSAQSSRRRARGAPAAVFFCNLQNLHNLPVEQYARAKRLACMQPPRTPLHWQICRRVGALQKTAP